jgi:hypothetical protein
LNTAAYRHARRQRQPGARTQLRLGIGGAAAGQVDAHDGGPAKGGIDEQRRILADEEFVIGGDLAHAQRQRADGNEHQQGEVKHRVAERQPEAGQGTGTLESHQYQKAVE